nr:hypothetical protein [Tanacetum cinerariifolium]
RWVELLSNYKCDLKYHPGKANVVADALSRKERLKLRRVRAISMTIHFGLKTKILEAQREAAKDLKALVEWLRGLDSQFEKQGNEGIYFVKRIWIPSVGALQKTLGIGLDMSTTYHPQTDVGILTFYWLSFLITTVTTRALNVHLLKHCTCETTKKIMQIKERLKMVQDFQKSYAHKRRKPFEFKVEDLVLLKVALWKGVVRFGKKIKLAPRYVGPFEIVECVGPAAYRLRLPQELSCVHDIFHVSNLKKCLADSDLQVPLEDIKVDDKLYFVEEHVEIVDRQVKKLKRSWIPIVKVRWDS